MNFNEEGIVILNELLKFENVPIVFDGDIHKFIDGIYNYNKNVILNKQGVCVGVVFNILFDNYAVYIDITNSGISITLNNDGYIIKINEFIIKVKDTKYDFRLKIYSEFPDYDDEGFIITDYNIFNCINYDLIDSILNKFTDYFLNTKYDKELILIFNILDIINNK